MTGENQIKKDDLFHLLQNPRRRAVLRHLLEHDDRDQFTLRDVSEQVAAWEHDTTVRDLTSKERQRVYIALYQSHLPKLDDLGVVSYDQSRGTVEPTSLVKVFQPYLGGGLHADTEELTTTRGAGEREESGLTRAVTSLLSK